jgi:Mg2+ and Co2+ transporter CorA
MLTDAGVDQAFASRRELISFKKVCLHLFQQILEVEKDLRQLSTFFFCDLLAVDSDMDANEADELRISQDRYRELSQSMNHCKGLMQATHDARFFTKVCDRPRHMVLPVIVKSAL